jgi:hypothetical protein
MTRIWNEETGEPQDVTYYREPQEFRMPEVEKTVIEGYHDAIAD